MKTSLLVLLLVGVLSSTHAFARDGQERAKYDEFYTVREPVSRSSAEESSFATLDLFWDQVDEAIALGSRIYSLLNFDHHQETYGDVLEPYNRVKHFGTWISPTDPEGRCYNTRAQVLERDSLTPVSMSSSGCTVARGTWDDPYTNRTYTQARDLQIDHFVPLKNAYISGADKWGWKRRCLYANYMGNDFHLMPVFGKENMKKSDRTPERYMPPNKGFQCQYLAYWLKIKVIWSLGLTPPEKKAIEDLAKVNHCDTMDFKFTQNELQKQRRFIADNKDLCQ